LELLVGEYSLDALCMALNIHKSATG
jgi:hypothetical protein